MNIYLGAVYYCLLTADQTDWVSKSDSVSSRCVYQITDLTEI